MLEHTQWKHFDCRRCGRCCAEIGLPFEPGQISEIARFLGFTTDKVIERYYGSFSPDRKSWVSEKHKRTPCPFVMTIASNQKACAIYPVRPKACRQYPFESTFDSNWLDCPGAKSAFDKQRNENPLQT